MTDNLYTTLGVERDAGAADIKDAYRRRVKETHPDRGGNEAEFRQIQKAWKVLRNDQKRERYDKYGETEPNEALRRLQKLANNVISLDHDDFLTEPLRELRGLHDELHAKGKKIEAKLEKIEKDLDALKEAEKEDDCHYVVSALLTLRKGLSEMKQENDDDVKLCLEVLTQYQLAVDLLGRAPKARPQSGSIVFNITGFGL